MLTIIKRVSLLLLVFFFTLSLLSDQVFAGTHKVIIDPGHGGTDSGAIGNGLYEKDLTLEISKKVKAYIDRNYNINTKMTRTNDTYVSLNNVQTLQTNGKLIYFYQFMLMRVEDLVMKTISIVHLPLLGQLLNKMKQHQLKLKKQLEAKLIRF